MVDNDDRIVLKTNQQLKMINSLNNSKRLEFISKCRVLKHFKSRNLYSNGVYILSNLFIGKRLHNNISGYTFWKNEINALKRV